jgi:hypothetical protein
VRFHEASHDLSHMLSKLGEEVHLVKEVVTRNRVVDAWLKAFEASMVETGKDALFRAFAKMGEQEMQEWIAERPGQSTFLSSQIWFTMRVQAIFAGTAERGPRYLGNRAEEDEQEGSEADPEEAESKFPVTAPPENKERVGGENGEEGDPDEDEERAYLEELHRQVAREAVSEPEKAQLERVLRLR